MRGDLRGDERQGRVQRQGAVQEGRRGAAGFEALAAPGGGDLVDVNLAAAAAGGGRSSSAGGERLWGVGVRVLGVIRGGGGRRRIVCPPFSPLKRNQ